MLVLLARFSWSTPYRVPEPRASLTSASQHFCPLKGELQSKCFESEGLQNEQHPTSVSLFSLRYWATYKERHKTEGFYRVYIGCYNPLAPEQVRAIRAEPQQIFEVWLLQYPTCAFPQETDGKERRKASQTCCGVRRGWLWQAGGEEGCPTLGLRQPAGRRGRGPYDSFPMQGVKRANEAISSWCSGEKRQEKWAWWSDNPLQKQNWLLASMTSLDDRDDLQTLQLLGNGLDTKPPINSYSSTAWFQGLYFLSQNINKENPGFKHSI